MKADILKIGAINLNKEGALLIVKPFKHDVWIHVGGKIEDGETPEECLLREIQEELGVGVTGAPTFFMESPIEKAAGDPKGRTIQIHSYIATLDGEPKPSSEIEALHWLTKEEFESGEYEIASILRKHTIPKLIQDGLMK